MSWMDVIKLKGRLNQSQKDLIDEIMSDNKPRTAREVIVDWLDLLEVKRKEKKTLAGNRRQKDRHGHGDYWILTNKSIPTYKQVRYYLGHSLKYLQVGEDDLGRIRYKAGEEE